MVFCVKFFLVIGLGTKVVRDTALSKKNFTFKGEVSISVSLNNFSWNLLFKDMLVLIWKSFQLILDLKRWQLILKPNFLRSNSILVSILISFSICLSKFFNTQVKFTNRKDYGNFEFFYNQSSRI